MDLKKLTSGAGTLFNRAKQFTEEKLGHAEKTEYDETFQAMLDCSDKTRNWTEKIVKQTEAFLQPNPAIRVEEKMQEKLQGYKATRLMETDLLGAVMIDAGNDLSSGAPAYGGALVKCGELQQKIGSVNREFIQTAVNSFLQPLQAFLDEEIKTLQKERSALETKRLDLDAAKSKVKRCKPPGTGTAQDSEYTKAEAELSLSQTDFDKQIVVVKLLLDGVATAHLRHLRSLQEFVEAQSLFYAQCHQYSQDLQRQLSAR